MRPGGLVADDESAAPRDDAERRLQLGIDALRPQGTAEFRFRSLDQAIRLATLLAQLSPRPEDALLGLTELFTNAVEHGNLGITYAEKSALMRAGTWQEEVSRRLALAEYANRQVSVHVARRPGDLRLTIRDDGAGFDWRRYLDFDPERAADPNGRGIALARLTSFDTLEYLGNGNTVVAAIFAPPTLSPLC